MKYRLMLTDPQFEYAVEHMDLRASVRKRLREFFVLGREIKDIAKEYNVTGTAVRQHVLRFEEQLMLKLEADKKSLVVAFLDDDFVPTLRDTEEEGLTL